MKPLKIPKNLEVFAWNLYWDTPKNRAFFALNVIEKGRAHHWKKIPKNWFNPELALRHGRPVTKNFIQHLLKKTDAL